MKNYWYILTHLRPILQKKKELKRLGQHGANVIIGSNCIIDGHKNMYLGNDVSIGPNGVIYSTDAKLIIKDKVVIGPNVTIVTGDHNYTTVGKFICDEHNKLPQNDKDVIIESDVWIGANVTILKGVVIGRGAVIGANSLICEDVEPYSIMVSTKAHCIKKRFTEEEIKEHESKLYGTDSAK